MNRDNLIMFSFIFSFVFVIVGAMMKIMHLEFASFLLGIGLVALAVFVFTAVYETFESKKITRSEKLMWLFGFLFLGWFAAFIYIVQGRKRVIGKTSHN